MDADLADLCQQTVTTGRVTSVDRFNTPSYAQAPASWQARIELGEVQAMDADGNTVTAKGVAYLVPVAGQDAPTDGSQITLPSTYPATLRTLNLVNVKHEIDEYGAVDHYKVFFN